MASIPQGGIINLKVVAGATLTLSMVALSDKNVPTSYVNLTGYTAAAQIWDKPGRQGGFKLMDLTVVLGGTAGTIVVSATKVQTAELLKDGVWDLFLYSGANAYKFCKGNVHLEDRATV